MSDLNQPGVDDGIEGDVDLPDDGDIAGAPEPEPGGLGHTPMPPD